MPDHIGDSNKMDYTPPHSAKQINGEWSLMRGDVTVSRHAEQGDALFWRDHLNAAWAAGVEFGQNHDR